MTRNGEPGAGLVVAHARALAEIGRSYALTTRVPTCGDWTLSDLIWHVSEVHDFWHHVIGGRPNAGPDTYVRPDRPADDDSLPDLLDDVAHRLGDLLARADPGEAAWSWSDDHTVGFTIRRQTHEAMVHHLDAVLAVGVPLPHVEPALAADGIDELVTVMLTGVPNWARFEPDGTTVRLVAVDAERRWTLGGGRMIGTSPEGTTYDLDAYDLDAPVRPDHRLDHRSGPDGAEPGTTIAAPALDLLLWMWGRVPDERVDVTGDCAGRDRLRSTVADATT